MSLSRLDSPTLRHLSAQRTGDGDKAMFLGTVVDGHLLALPGVVSVT